MEDINMIEKGKWVLIHRNILEPSERAPQVPEDTKKVPLEMWIKGYLQVDAQIGDSVDVITRTGRKETGILLESEPYYKHDYGKFVPELMVVSEQVREILFGGDR
jgi:2-amino-4-ketopentanoate thiolase alpha subunit